MPNASPSSERPTAARRKRTNKIVRHEHRPSCARAFRFSRNPASPVPFSAPGMLNIVRYLRLSAIFRRCKLRPNGHVRDLHRHILAMRSERCCCANSEIERVARSALSVLPRRQFGTSLRASWQHRAADRLRSGQEKPADMRRKALGISGGAPGARRADLSPAMKRPQIEHTVDPSPPMSLGDKAAQRPAQAEFQLLARPMPHRCPTEAQRLSAQPDPNWKRQSMMCKQSMMCNDRANGETNPSDPTRLKSMSS